MPQKINNSAKKAFTESIKQILMKQQKDHKTL